MALKNGSRTITLVLLCLTLLSGCGPKHPTTLSGRWWIDFNRSKRVSGERLPPTLSNIFIDFEQGGKWSMWFSGVWISGTYKVEGDRVALSEGKDSAAMLNLLSGTGRQGGPVSLEFVEPEVILWRTNEKTPASALLYFSPKAGLGRQKGQ